MTTKIEALVDDVIREIEKNKLKRGDAAKKGEETMKDPEKRAEQDIKQQFAKFAVIDDREFFATDFGETGVSHAAEVSLENAEHDYFAAKQLAGHEPQLTSVYQEINSSGYLSPAAKSRMSSLLNGLFWSEVRNRLLAARSKLEVITDASRLTIENPPKPALPADKASAAALIRAEITEDLAHAIGEAAPGGVSAVREVFGPALVSAFENPDPDMPAAIIRAARRNLGASTEGREILKSIERDYTANLSAYTEAHESTSVRQAKAALKAAGEIYRAGEHDGFLRAVLQKASSTRYNGSNVSEIDYSVGNSPVFMRGQFL